MPDIGVAPHRAPSIESRESWTAACLTLAILSISYGSPLLVVVGLKPIQEALGTDRSVIAPGSANGGAAVARWRSWRPIAWSVSVSKPVPTLPA